MRLGMALDVALASSAFAAAVTQDVAWFVGDAKLAAEEVKAKQIGIGTFTTTVALTPVELEATGC